MENKRSSDVLNSTSDFGVPSGFEVESARTHIPTVIRESVSSDHLLSDHSHDGSVKDRLHHLKQRATESMISMQRDMSGRMTTMQRTMSNRVASLGSMASERMTSLRSGAEGQVSRIQSEMKSNPGKWAGIAAGAGFGIGLVGRIMRHRAKRSALPHLVIIESSC